MLEILLFGVLLLGCLANSRDGDGNGRSSSKRKSRKSGQSSSASSQGKRAAKAGGKKPVETSASAAASSAVKKHLPEIRKDTPAKKSGAMSSPKKPSRSHKRSQLGSTSTAKIRNRVKAAPRSQERRRPSLTKTKKPSSKSFGKSKSNAAKATSQVLDAENESVVESSAPETSARVDRDLAIEKIREYIHPDILKDPVVTIPPHHIKGRTRYRQNEVSILKRYGYRVSRRDYISPWLRQQILLYALIADIDVDLPFVDESYRKQWGPPLSMARYSRIRRHLLGLMRDRHQRYRHEWALSQWALDEEWFRTCWLPIVKLVEP